MKEIYFIILSLLLFQIGFSQDRKSLSGKVTENGIPIERADVINFTSKKSTFTNQNGSYTILAKVNDTILFYHKDYYSQQIILTKKNIDATTLSVELLIDPVQLKEVVIDKGTTMQIHITQADIDETKLQMAQERPKVVGSYDGSIPNGIDFARIGKGLYKEGKKLFKKKVDHFTTISTIPFKDYVSANIKEDYFTNQLNLNKKDVALFLDFCDADARANTPAVQSNILSLMDYLSSKKIEFEKLLSSVK